MSRKRMGAVMTGLVALVVAGAACTSTSQDSCTSQGCAHDPAPTASAVMLCTSALADAKCGKQYQAYLDCAQQHPYCNSLGNGDPSAVAAACSTQSAEYMSCSGASIPQPASSADASTPPNPGPSISDASSSDAGAGGPIEVTQADTCSPGTSGSCCYAPDSQGLVNGTPDCRWKRLTNGQHTTIMVRSVSSGVPTGPFMPVDLSAVIPDHLGADGGSGCRNLPAGYLISAPGGNGTVTSDITDWSVNAATGAWQNIDEGAGVVCATFDPADAGTSQSQLHAGIYACDGITGTTSRRGINVMSSVDYSTSQGSFHADFAADSKMRNDGSPFAYYLVMVR